VHEGRLDVAALSRALEIRFPYDPNEHQLAVDGNDLDGDFLTDNEELAAGYNLYNSDQDEDLTADGIELARQCAEVISELPVPDPNGPGLRMPGWTNLSKCLKFSTIIWNTALSAIRVTFTKKAELMWPF